VDEETKEQFQRVIDVVLERMSDTDRRVDELRKHFAESQNSVVTILDSVVNDLGQLRTEYYSITAALGRLERSSDEVLSRLGNVEERLTRLEHQTAQHGDS
jgi:chromosome segregation ATPase